jgi:TetR/AcrR family transcriptional regulator, transcriptional repressor for nem operon
MARPKEFDHTKALDKAMHLFWQQGYEKTSMEDLCKHMGINRGSLYGTFGSKHSLFLEAIQHYKDINIVKFDLEDEAFSGISAIRVMFSDIVEASVMDTSRSGCLIANTIAELASQDTEIAEMCMDNRRGYENLFHRLLTQSEQTGELSSGHNLTQLARFLVNTIYGLRITAKTTNDRDILEDIVNTALSILV